MYVPQIIFMTFRPYMFPEFFEREMHDDHEAPPAVIPVYKPRPAPSGTDSFLGRMEKQRSYCRAIPTFRNPTPKQDAKILVKGTVTLPLWASSTSGKITRYEVSMQSLIWDFCRFLS